MHRLIILQAPVEVQAPAVRAVSNYAGASMAFHHGVYTPFADVQEVRYINALLLLI